jgi:hypothetical protein
MLSAERGEEIVKSHLVGQVDGRESQAPLVTVATEEVVVSNTGIEYSSAPQAGIASVRRTAVPSKTVSCKRISDTLA